MTMFHIQLHPNDKSNAIQRAESALKATSPAVGLDFGDVGEFSNLPIDNLKNDQIAQLRAKHREVWGEEGATSSLLEFRKLAKGDVVLVRGGGEPVALVKVIGPYCFFPDVQEEDALWFRHRFPVRVIGWYKDDVKKFPDIRHTPPSRGTFASLKDEQKRTYKALTRWLQHKDDEMISEVLKETGQIVLVGPPGTSKTHQAKQLTAALLGLDSPQNDESFRKAQFSKSDGKGSGCWEIVQFHPSYNYEDFVRGVRARAEDRGITYETVDRVFGAMCRAAKDNDQGKYVLIIDEINRANVAAVFGELLYALEYRGEKVSTPYEVEGDATLSVPENLFIIGTMNTADRSIGHIDYAIRRRFAFVECKPERQVIEGYGFTETSDRSLALEMYDAVAKLFEKSFLSSDHRASDVRVGHTYFIGSGINEAKLRMKFKYQVLPLLREYLADGVFRPEAEKAINDLATRFGG